MQTRYTQLLGCEVPVQLAGMGWVAGPDLALAVAGAGGVGTIAPHLVPGAVLEPVLDDLADRAQGRPVGFNALLPFLDVAAVEQAAQRLRFVEFFWGEPDPSLVRRVHAHGALAMWQVGSADEAAAAEQAGCDVVIAQGVEAGGHVRGTTGLLPLLDAVLEQVSVPVVASGGITTPRGLAAVLAAGADAARLGTLFVATPEADAHPDYVTALLAADGSDTVHTTAFGTGWPDAPHRVLRSCVQAAQAVTDEVVGSFELGGNELPVPRLGVQAPLRSTSGQVHAMALYAGQGVGAVRAVRPAAEVVRELAGGAQALLARHAGVPSA